jgi:hypothetical protein
MSGITGRNGPGAERRIPGQMSGIPVDKGFFLGYPY